MCICSNKQRTNPFTFFFGELGKLKLSNKLICNLQKRAELLAEKFFKSFDNLATTIFFNGTIYTMDQENPIVEALAIKDNKILKAGRRQDVFAFKGSSTKIIDLEKKVVLPGFIDPHIHMCFSMIDHWLDLGPYANKNMKEVKDKIYQALQQARKDQLLTGQLFDPTITSGQFDVSLEGLDHISQQIGIFILQANGHIAHVNTAAFKLAGIDRNTKDPPHGRLMRDLNGQLTGQVQQSAIGLFKQKFPQISEQQYKLNFKNFLQKCSTKGCTSLHDCGIGFIDPKADLSALYEVFNEGAPVRYSGFLVSTAWQTWKEHNLTPCKNDNDLRIIGMKCWSDGSIQGGSGFLKHDYLKKQWGRGSPNYEQQELQKSIKKAHNEGWQVGVHTNGDAAMQMVLDAYESVQRSNPRPQLRHRIEHSTICQFQHLYRMKQLRLSPSFLIGHIYYYGEVFEQILGQQRARKIDPLRSAFDYCLKPTIHSDYNCQPVDPLRCIYNAVTRRMKRSKRVLNEKQCISAYQGVQAMTINAAWQCQMDDIVGSLQQGKMADLVILEQDPMRINPQQIINIKISSTWKDGKITYKSF